MKSKNALGREPRVRYWMGVASKDHVMRGVEGSFCQLCHGKPQPLTKMNVGDWLIYYSPKEYFGGDIACQQFTAIGEVTGENAYLYKMSADFTPHRRDVQFLDAAPADIKPLLDKLTFVKDKARWGYAFRFGHFEMSHSDFSIIATEILGFNPVTSTQIHRQSIHSTHSALPMQ